MDSKTEELVRKARAYLNEKGIDDDMVYDLFVYMAKHSASFEEAVEAFEKDMKEAQEKVAYDNYKRMIKVDYLNLPE